MRYKVNDEVLIKARIKDMSYVDMMYVCELVTNPDVCIRFKSPTECIVTDKTYEMGLNDAWQLAKKILEMPHNDYVCMFGDIYTSKMMENLTAEEALAKIEAYEREDVIKLGDEVVHSCDGYKTKFYVTYLNASQIKGIDKDGNTHYYTLPNRHIKKTGKHIDIESLLKQIGE